MRAHALAAALLAAAAFGQEPTVPEPAVAGQKVPRRHLGRVTPATSRLQPSDLRYLGAFRLPDRPDGAPEVATWDYGGHLFVVERFGDGTRPLIHVWKVQG